MHTCCHPSIRVSKLSKRFRYHEKEPGLLQSFRSLFSRRYVQRCALREVSFSVEEGEAVGLLGPNGSGKSTLIKCLTGVLQPAGGRIRVAEEEPQRRSGAFLRSIGAVLGQKSQLLWELPPWDGFLLHGRMYGLDDETVRRRAGTLAEMLRVSDNLTQPLRRLSLGQRMKCEIIAVLLHRPSVLFLDEPTIGLDAVARRDIRRFLGELVQHERVTVLLSSHLLQDIEAVTSRVLLLDRGELIYDGPLEGLDVRMQMRRVQVELGRLEAGQRQELIFRLRGLDGVSLKLIEEERVEFLAEADSLGDAAGAVFSAGDVSVSIAEPRAEQILADHFDRLNRGEAHRVRHD